MHKHYFMLSVDRMISPTHSLRNVLEKFHFSCLNSYFKILPNYDHGFSCFLKSLSLPAGSFFSCREETKIKPCACTLQFSILKQASSWSSNQGPKSCSVHGSGTFSVFMVTITGYRITFSFPERVLLLAQAQVGLLLAWHYHPPTPIKTRFLSSSFP